MGGDISLDGDVASLQPDVDPESKQDSKKSKSKNEATNSLPLYKLFSFADPLDHLLMFVGTVGATGNGISMPLMLLIFGNMINAFGSKTPKKLLMKFPRDRLQELEAYIFKQFLRQDVTFFDKETSTGEVVGRMSGDTVLIQDAMGREGMASNCCHAILYSTSRLVWCYVELVYYKSISQGTSSLFYRCKCSRADNRLYHSLGKKRALAKYNQSLIKAYKTGVQEALASGLGFSAVFFVFYASFGLAVSWAGISKLECFAAGQAAAFKMFETIKRKPEIDAYDTTGRQLDDIRGDIELRDAGEVLIDGINLKEFQLKWIRQKIGLVSQEPVLFTCSIKENIAYGKDGATDEEIKAAAELANAAKFIDKLPQGLDTMVGEHGTQLSGGQKQRVAIARAILKDPRILLLDEATSALDAESERIVQEALDRIMINRTTVIVAHRLSTIRNADTIAVIHQGKIVEKGSHAELTKDPDGAYSQLIRLQEMKGSEQNVANDTDKPESIIHSGRQSSQRSFSLRSISRGSSGVGNSSRHSFSASYVVPTTGGEVEAPPSTIPSPPPEVSLYRLASLNKPEILVLLMGTIAAVLHGVITPIFGLLLSKMISIFYEPAHELRHDSKVWAIVFVALGVAALLIIPCRFYFFGVAGASIRALVGDALGLLVQNIATAIAGLVIAFEASWQLAFIILALAPLLGLNGYLQLKLLKGFSADAKKMYEEASQVANDAVGSIRTVASFCAEEKVMELYQEKFYACSFYAGARLVEDGKTTMTDVFRVRLFALSMAAMGISHSGSLVPDSSNAKGAAASIFAILDRKSLIDPSDESGITLEEVKGEIELKHVSFKYPTRPDVQIFRDLCLTIHSGKTVALVGESGSGKSTVISLLQRFYDPDSGHITLDGKEIQRLQVKWLRQQMGLVSQEPVLFNDTIRANIAYGKEGDATEAEIIAAAELANAHQFISSLQKGYDTIVGERGVQLSGGQKQRVAIARAIVKNPKILLLDEATSALDAESEKVVQDALDRIMVDRTTIVVAHRLSTIKGADLIAVVKNGVIAEKGKHEALLHKGGHYASLVALHTSASSL
ncbi:P-loop containing nucleoside triphosphate hydrolase [Sesbania bispinosa]|nr:P-loop containing nucleoside triphosphate hydrolase [Sesbania bispinosa]